MAKKVLVAMSGGVDSSVAAQLCINNCFECAGATMQLYKNENCDKPCGTQKDIADAKAVADTLSIPHHIFNFQDEFKTEIICRFIDTYKRGATPNPCIDCNRFIKFGMLLKKMEELGFSHIATGHYARIEEKDGRFLLKKAVDESKDQSYVLYSLTQKQLSHILLPLGDYKKSEIREIAQKYGFVTADKQDSQDICFVPDGDYATFIEQYINYKFPDGDFVDLNGKKLGTHKGIIRYTIGQRKGLGLALPAPMYVCEKDVENNRVVLCNNDELFSRELIATDFNWLAFDNPKNSFECSVKVRYKHTEQPATITPLENGNVKIVFKEPQRAIAKGQAAVLYDSDIVIGGGTII